MALLDPKAFARERALRLPTLVSLLLNLRKGTIQDELDQFANLLSDGERLQGVTAGGYWRSIAPPCDETRWPTQRFKAL